MSEETLLQTIRYYFVDEAGDGTIYGGKGKNKGKVLIGSEGVSRYFMLGILDVPNPEALSVQLANLHQELLADPYFRKVPSFQPQNHKTALFFHAKDDLPEIRREVFKLLIKHEGLRFFAVVRDKNRVRRQYEEWGKKYHPNLLYDGIMSRVFRDRLHKEATYQIYFAARGKADRTYALRQSLMALQKARKRFTKKWGKSSNANLNVQALPASQHYCLQASDYVLWALQRLYERREDRYFDYIASMCSLIHDVDDIRENKKGKEYGVYYSRQKPLSLDKLPPLAGTEDIG